MKTLNWVAMILVIIGGLNWGLVGLLDYNIVDAIFGMGSTLSKIIYILVGVSAIYVLVICPKMMKKGPAAM